MAVVVVRPVHPGRVAVSLRLCLVCVAAAATAAVAAAAPQPAAAVLWQSFHHQWLRNVVGFETPHRMGSIANHFTAEAAADNVFTATFTPGVDGDFAHPAAGYQCFQPRPGVQVARATASLTFNQTTALPAAHPQSETEVSARVELPLAPGAVTAFLDGFAIDMRCVGAGCNSNGAWVWKLRLAVGACEAASSSSVACTVDVGLARGWTPSHGGGKAYNANMTFAVTVPVLAVSGGTPHPATMAESSTIFSGPVRAVHNVTGAGAAPLVVGMTGFSYELDVTDGRLDRGRYLQAVGFGVAPEPNGASYAVTAEFLAPKLTTYPANVRYEVNTTAVAGVAAAVSAQHTVQGTICEDDKPLFFCKAKGLPNSLTTTVPFQCSV